jgi:hypothetical protein
VADEHTATVVARLSAGLAELEPLLAQHGFQVSSREAGKASGGYLATADFTHAGRTLHLWLRGNSLSVRYDIDGHQLDHAAYMRELLGPGGGNQFPSYSDDAAAAFRALRHDLERLGRDFLSGRGDDYLRCWKAVNEDSARSGFQRLARIEQQMKQD